jgi:hypothetical protein
VKFSPKEPFKVAPIDEKKVVVHFAPIVSRLRTRESDDELSGLVDDYDFIACDLSRTKLIASDWLRFLNRLTIKAKSTGKILALAGLQANVLEMADILALKNFVKVRQVEEVWSS